MPISSVPNSDLKYYLIAFDAAGEERGDDPAAPGGRLSDAVVETLATTPVTDVFLMSHGWQGDVPAAVRQYDAWTGAMLRCEADREAVRRVRPGFTPLLVGLHWPSLPWGDEDLATGSLSFDLSGADPLAGLVDEAAARLAESDRARQALRTIFAAALDDAVPSRLPPEVAAAYEVLWHEAGLAASGPGAPPGEDAESFDPEGSYQAARSADAVAFGGGVLGGLLTPLRQLSFWKMKQRARSFGERGGAALLRRLMARAGDGVRFHLMGHSFGCIVVSATVAGAGAAEPLPRPVDSLFLVQGALSFWSYCSSIPVAPGKAGYFHPIVRERKVRGPVMTTQSVYDTAVGKLYPLAAGLAGQVSFAPGELPKYGAVGAFGVRGPGVEAVDLEILPADGDYGFTPGGVYNVESSRVICEGRGPAGAHSDIAKPEVAHILWSAVRLAGA
jgi:hypothetical protein